VHVAVRHPSPGCLRVTSRTGRCVVCGGGTTTQRGHGAEWHKRRARQARAHPICEWRPVAGARPCGRPATAVDHIVPKVHGGSAEPANLQSLCARHHRRKSVTQDRAHGLAASSPGPAAVDGLRPSELGRRRSEPAGGTSVAGCCCGASRPRTDRYSTGSSGNGTDSPIGSTAMRWPVTVPGPTCWPTGRPMASAMAAGGSKV